MQPMSPTFNSTVAKREVAPAICQAACCLPASTLYAATNPADSGASLHVLSSGGNRPKPQGRSLVPPLMDGWQHKRNRLKEGPVSEHASPFVASRSLSKGSSGPGNLHEPSNVGVQGRFHRPFLGACRQLDDEGMEDWQQQVCVMEGSVSARSWVEFQKEVSRWKWHHSNAGRVRGLLKDQDLQSESTTASSTPTNSAALNSSIASAVDDLVPVGHGLSTKHDEANGAEQQLWHSDGHAWLLKQNHMAIEHFNMASDDWLEVEEEFFPENCNAIDCS